MSLVDSNGKLFGRVNALDGFVLALVVAAAGLFAIRALRHEPMSLAAVRPASLTTGQPMRVQLEGAGFRQFLQVFVGRTGQPFVLMEADRLSQRAVFMVSSPTRAELQLPNLEPGSYDLYVYDQGDLLASRTGALSIESPRLPRGTRDVKVRFYPVAETVPLIHVGDRDTDGAVVTGARVAAEFTDVMEMRLTDHDSVWTGQKMKGQLVELSMSVPLQESAPDTWVYRDQPVRAGDVFALATDRYRLHGVVVWVGDVTRAAAAR